MILYFNQTSRYCAGVNDLAQDLGHGFTFEKLPVELTLDNSKWSFISHNTAVCALSNGDIYVVRIINDGRAIQHIELVKSVAGVLPSCVCKPCRFRIFYTI